MRSSTTLFRRALSLALVSALLAPCLSRADAPVVAGAERVDGLVAVVGGLAPGGKVISILRSDVELRARIALAAAGGAESALVPLPASLLRATFEEIFGEALIAAEAARLSLAPPSVEDLRRERARFIERAGGEATLYALFEALTVEPRELDAIVRRRAVVSGFLNANLEGTLEVTDAELDAAYANEEHPFHDRPLAEVRPAFRAWLEQRRLQDAVSRWVRSLKERTPHRLLSEI